MSRGNAHLEKQRQEKIAAAGRAVCAAAHRGLRIKNGRVWEHTHTTARRSNTQTQLGLQYAYLSVEGSVGIGLCSALKTDFFDFCSPRRSTAPFASYHRPLANDTGRRAKPISPTSRHMRGVGRVAERSVRQTAYRAYMSTRQMHTDLEARGVMRCPCLHLL